MLNEKIVTHCKAKRNRGKQMTNIQNKSKLTEVNPIMSIIPLCQYIKCDWFKQYEGRDWYWIKARLDNMLL